MHSTRYIYTFVFIMTVVVAVVLAGMNTFLKPIHQANEAIFNKRAVLKAVSDSVDDMSDEEVVSFFSKNVQQSVYDMEGKKYEEADVKKARNFKDKPGLAEDLDLAKEKKKSEKERLHPLYIYNNPESGRKNYITAVRGSGLWDEIWGYIALDADKNTIVGTSFDHKGETPGLGAEIKDNPTFPTSFKNKKIMNKEGEYVSVLVKKGGADKTNLHAVDGISGATVTCDGVTEMLERGLRYYEKALAKL